MAVNRTTVGNWFAAAGPLSCAGFGPPLATVVCVVSLARRQAAGGGDEFGCVASRRSAAGGAVPAAGQARERGDGPGLPGPVTGRAPGGGEGDPAAASRGRQLPGQVRARGVRGA